MYQVRVAAHLLHHLPLEALETELRELKHNKKIYTTQTTELGDTLCCGLWFQGVKLADVRSQKKDKLSPSEARVE